MPLCPRALPVVSLSYLPTKPGLLLSLGARPAALQCVTDIRTVGSSCPREAETDRLLALVPWPLLAPLSIGTGSQYQRLTCGAVTLLCLKGHPFW